MSTSDILVIGGGIAGLSAAAALSPHAKVTVLEAEEQIGFHSSGRSATMLHYALGDRLVRALTLASSSFFDDPPEDFADVPVGRVDEIELGDDWTAVVTVTVNGDVDLPANAVAAIQQSSLLGEKYIELAAPGGVRSQGQLEDGALIPLERTNRNVEVEELLGALSLVLNGGGLAQLQTINRELGEAL